MIYSHLHTVERLYAVVVESLRRLGDDSSLHQIYRMCEFVDPEWNDFSAGFKDIESAIRWTLQKNCAESKAFDTQKNRDTFQNPSRGVWGLKTKEESGLIERWAA